MPTMPRAIQTVVCVSIGILGCGATYAAEPAHPDFTGLWTGHREAGRAGLSGFGGPRAGLPLTDEGRRRVEDYSKLLGP